MVTVGTECAQARVAALLVPRHEDVSRVIAWHESLTQVIVAAGDAMRR
jgi:hypothetical protein